MKLLFVFLGMTFSMASVAFDSGILSVGSYNVCVIDSEGVKCWGRHGDVFKNIPPLKNPRSVTVGAWHACALDDEGLKCWGYDDESYSKGQFEVLQLQNPRQVSAGEWHTCALADEGVKCYGSNTFGKTKVPRWLRHPKQVAVGLYHSCAIYSGGVKCWGNDTFGETRVPRLKNPKQISLGYHHSCALDDNGVKCWGHNKYGQNSIPDLKNPTKISVAGYHSCALDDDGVKCWGSSGISKVPPLINPRQISAGESFVCALDDEGVKCWGHESSQDMPPFNFGLPAPDFELKNLSNFFKIVAQGSTPAKSKILNDLYQYSDKELTEEKFPSSFKKPELSAARYTLAALIDPIIRSSDSEYYLDKVIPAYETSLSKINKELVIDGAHELPDFSSVREVALKVMQVSLSVGSEFLTVSERKELQESVRLLGAALAQVENKESVVKAIEGLEKQRNLLGKLEKSAKTAFLYQTIYSASEFLTSVMR
jgi:hypothetical protein